MDLDDQLLEDGIAHLPDRGGGQALLVRVVGGGGDLAVVPGQDTADRLDTAEADPVLVDERYERVCGRSSPAAKKPAAALRISFARFSSAISLFIALICADSSEVVPGLDHSRARAGVGGPGWDVRFPAVRPVG